MLYCIISTFTNEWQSFLISFQCISSIFTVFYYVLCLLMFYFYVKITRINSYHTFLSDFGTSPIWSCLNTFDCPEFLRAHAVKVSHKVFKRGTISLFSFLVSSHSLKHGLFNKTLALFLSSLIYNLCNTNLHNTNLLPYFIFYTVYLYKWYTVLLYLSHLRNKWRQQLITFQSQTTITNSLIIYLKQNIIMRNIILSHCWGTHYFLSKEMDSFFSDPHNIKRKRLLWWTVWHLGILVIENQNCYYLLHCVAFKTVKIIVMWSFENRYVKK